MRRSEGGGGAVRTTQRRAAVVARAGRHAPVGDAEEELHDARALVLERAVVDALHRVGAEVQQGALGGEQLLRLAVGGLLEVVEVHGLARAHRGAGVLQRLRQRAPVRLVLHHAQARRGGGPAARGRRLRLREARPLARVALHGRLEQRRHVLAAGAGREKAERRGRGGVRASAREGGGGRGRSGGAESPAAAAARRRGGCERTRRPRRRASPAARA